MKEKLGINPWVSAWVKPRNTIAALIQYNVNYRFIVLCAFYGFQTMLQTSQFLSLGRDYSLLFVLILSLVLSIPIGYIMFNISSLFVLWLGKLIKGKGSFKEIRAATYWSSVPNVIISFLWIILMIALGNGLFIAGYERDLMGSAVSINMGISILRIVLGVWGFIIFLKMLGEVQGFSAWMALLNAVLAGISMSAVLFVITWGISLVTHVS